MSSHFLIPAFGLAEYVFRDFGVTSHFLTFPFLSSVSILKCDATMSQNNSSSGHSRRLFLLSSRKKYASSTIFPFHISVFSALGVETAYDFAQHNQTWVRATFNNIVVERTWRELNGDDCVPNEEMAKKKSICTSRSFNGMITDIDALRTHVSNYAARCAEKLRQQGTVASIVGVFLNTNVFREDLPQYWNYQDMRLLTPSSSTSTIVKAAGELLQRLYRQGYHYKKAGVIVMGIGPNSPIQQDLFDINAEQFEKMRRLDAVIDRINKVGGSETIVLGSQQYTQKDGKGKAEVFANAIKHDFKSKNPTTRWSDIIVLK